ncbi:DNA-directed RNA polymerase subunit alpha C-terminal domain-containing protein [Clostridium scatologenes]|uniref:RNA polymerase alpha subunit C-terminal domain-containing protein n=1 Tax=Clostridium scatologenes TaxID=1548 RepID=A0A0E3GRK5_CLOSL|nr:DNA-directed RNA polymerase subunit alpha C-terminal domain-containing protein [Clostridium scatologenes]AKA70481.1 hypothetical protein CSCA_3356 [Clostridium scatologenes]
MPNLYTRNLEIVHKAKEGKTCEELAKEYNLCCAAITFIIKKHKEFEAYCNEMETLKAKNEINEETKLYDLSKLLKFDTRSIKALVYKNIKSIDKLLALSEEDIYTIRSLGKASQKYVKECIIEYREKMNQHANLFGIDINNTKKVTDNLEESLIQKSVIEPEVSIKANREYIYKLIRAVDNGQVDSRFLEKEISKEFDRIENINKELLRTLINLQKSRNMP